MAAQLRPPQRDEMTVHFAPTDRGAGADLTRFPWLRKLLKSRTFQFAFILPNQIIFWIVIVAGLLGANVPTRNFATVITWYIWFCAVFLLMVGIGRGWCLMCPFGGFAEWVQRLTFSSRRFTSVTLGKRWPEKLSRYGLLPSVGVFIVLTYFEEFFNIAGPGVPKYTSFLVLGVISLALLFFLVFERRTFCRYICPLSALIGTVGATGMVAGFRTKDRNVCLSCQTKDCMRGSENGYPCPWYEWPGSASSNLACGLCSECFKSCPNDNIGLFVQPPLTSVIAPRARRYDIALGVLLLFGLVLFQQVNALPIYGTIDNWLNSVMHFPGYPNPIDYLAIIALFAAAFSGAMWAIGRAFAKDRRTRNFKTWLKPLAYAMIPLVAADFLARQLPRFFDHMLRIVPSISNPFAWNWNVFGTAGSLLYGVHLLTQNGVVAAQLAVIAIGGLGSLYSLHRITRLDLSSLTNRPVLMEIASIALMVLTTLGTGWLYVAMAGAQ